MLGTAVAVTHTCILGTVCGTRTVKSSIVHISTLLLHALKYSRICLIDISSLCSNCISA
jgi:hypothetical protein